MNGRRIDQPEEGVFWLKPGEYGKHRNGDWMARTPNGLLGNLRNHDVIEHEDGTITVSPSILVTRGEKEVWHGYLEGGVWREC